jgi:hypothetical protein
MSIFLLVASRKGSIIASPTCSCRNGLGAQVSLALVVKAKNRSELAIFLRALTREVAVGLQPLFHRVQQAIDELIHATDHVKAFMLVVFQSLSYPGFKFYPLRMVHVDLLNRFDAGLRQDATLPDRAQVIQLSYSGPYSISSFLRRRGVRGDSAVPGGTFPVMSIFPALAALRAGLLSFAPSALERC